jgi:Lrp/AsnC family leucine-responsive transcriptional regulator
MQCPDRFNKIIPGIFAVLKVVSEDMNAYYDFHVNKLSQVENMGHVQSVFVMGIIKETHQLVY